MLIEEIEILGDTKHSMFNEEMVRSSFLPIGNEVVVIYFVRSFNTFDFGELRWGIPRQVLYNFQLVQLDLLFLIVLIGSP